MPNPEPPGIVVRFAAIVGRIRAALRSVRPAQVETATLEELATTTIAIAAWLWLDGVVAGVVRLAARIAAGTFKPSRPHAARNSLAPPGLPGLALPRGAGWLARLLPEPEPLAADLANLLADPELQPLLAQQPARFGRLLRPICRAMGLEPPEPLKPTETPPAIAGSATRTEAPCLARSEASAAPPTVRPNRRSRLLGATHLSLEIA